MEDDKSSHLCIYGVSNVDFFIFGLRKRIARQPGQNVLQGLVPWTRLPRTCVQQASNHLGCAGGLQEARGRCMSSLTAVGSF